MVCSHTFYFLQLMQLHPCCQNYSCLAMFNAFCSCFIDNIVRVLSFSTHSNCCFSSSCYLCEILCRYYSVYSQNFTISSFSPFFLLFFLFKYLFPKQINKTCSIWESDFFKKIITSNCLAFCSVNKNKDKC